ncbi:MAG: glutamine amidotransferase [Victivallales bacterium]
MYQRLIVRFVATSVTAVTLLGMTMTESLAAGRSCLVLADGYVSEYAWGKYDESHYPQYHPGHAFFVRGILDYSGRFGRWLEDYEVERIDLEKHTGALVLDKIDLVVIDDVRQYILAPYEPAIVEYVRRGGALLVYAGYWGLGGAPKDEYNVNKTTNNSHSPLAEILPVEIVGVPDWELKTKLWGSPVFKDMNLFDGMDAFQWKIYGLHACRAKGDVLAEINGKPLICSGVSGKGRMVVYTGDDLAWIRAGGRESIINPFSKSLWRRLARVAVGDDKGRAIPAISDQLPAWEKTAVFAHPDQPVNFVWGGYFPFSGVPELEKSWARDLVTHSCNFYMDGNVDTSKVLGEAGIAGSFAGGRWIPKKSCINTPETLLKMEAGIAGKASALTGSPWITYGHMGDEPEYGFCSCEHCQKKFKEMYGYDLPPLKSDFSPQYLDQWIDYCLFKNKSVGAMYKRAAQAAHAVNSNLKYMFASTPQCGGMAYGDDQLNTQSGFDLLWDHPYPGTQAIRVGLNSAILEETAVLQGRPYVPVYSLLQGFDSYDRVPNIPPPEYIRTMAWQAIAHGTDSVGWFIYNAYWWSMPGTEAWEEAGRMGKEVLEPLTPTLYRMLNTPQPIGLLYSYSQEAVDGLKALAPKETDPWNSVIRWWSLHALHEAYEVMKYAHLPFNVVSEHRLFRGDKLPWKAIVIPYVEHLHASSRSVLEKYIADGGIVYLGANSTLALKGAIRLPMSFDNFFTTWWPKDKPKEWNQRRSRIYTVGASLEKAVEMRRIFSPFLKETMVAVDDPEVVYNVRRAGDAKYIFFVNDHQINPVSAELRKKRQEYNHFMLMPMEFPKADTKISLRGQGYLYPLLPSSGAPLELKGDEGISMNLKLDGGAGAVFLLLPEQIARLEFISPPKRSKEGVRIEARILGSAGVIKAVLPLRIEIGCTEAKQTVYAATEDGAVSWTAPFLKEFPDAPLMVTITDLASGKSVQGCVP